MLPLLQEVSSVAFQAGARISILNITEPAGIFNICATEQTRIQLESEPFLCLFPVSIRI